jgi:anti-anti-sigma factor
MKLDVHVEAKDKDYYVVALDGQLDTKTAESCERKIEALLSQAVRFLIFDMKDLSYISSMGIRMIYKTEKTVRGSGGAVLMVKIQPQIEKILRIAAVLPKYQTFQSIEEADRHIAAIRSGCSTPAQ